MSRPTAPATASPSSTTPWPLSPGQNPELLAQLKQGLAVVMSAEALFVLTDLCRLPRADAIASAVRTARSLTAAAVRRG
jgi:hypothetical protein